MGAALLGALTFAAVTEAQDDEARARELFAAGRRDVAHGDLEAACDKFRQSHALAPEAVGPLLNLADCDERGGKVATAWRRLERAAELADDAEQRAYAQRRAEALAGRVPRLTLQLPPHAPDETAITRDGAAVDIDALGEERAVDPGRYRFVVRAPGHAEGVHEIDLREGEHVTLVLELGPAPMPSPGPATPDPSLAPAPPTPATALPAPLLEPASDATSSTTVAGWVVGGIGVAAAAVGIGTGIAVAVNADIYDDHCDADDRCDDTGLAAARRGEPLAIVSPVALTLGVVGIGIAIPLLLIDDDDASVQVTFSPRSLTLEGSF